MAARRISAEQAHRVVEKGEALLVCAYDDEAKCRQNQIDGALTMSAFRGRQPTLETNQQVIFYCA